VTMGITGPIGSGLPQFGFPRLFAIVRFVLPFCWKSAKKLWYLNTFDSVQPF
jgi:hypothetical protein